MHVHIGTYSFILQVLAFISLQCMRVGITPAIDFIRHSAYTTSYKRRLPEALYCFCGYMQRRRSANKYELINEVCVKRQSPPGRLTDRPKYVHIYAR
ncbi:hypothetical protein F5Y14DRAFT_423572 [Nemania sp. NC0429]|nr:hypothetical protein F5Y14DRAFT_423572 [Nemania sp. NC0429]